VCSDVHVYNARYSKEECLGEDEYGKFDLLINEKSSIEGFDFLHSVFGLERVSLFPPSVQLSPQLFIHRRANFTTRQ